ncbi:hypothetical protein ABZ330_35605 [Streptomyces sp. NPDC006172]|uniref:hypothetical protein n=1 Tax=Streptomyces sp. NPDC006172 TaxID=3154470 RepID=UPI003410F309
MPPRSRDLTALRRFAEAHAAAHAKAAAVRHDAACWCRHERCALHEGVRVACAGSVVLVLRHNPAVGQVWTLSEVCSACAPLMTHTRVLGRAAPPPREGVAAGPGRRAPAEQPAVSDSPGATSPRLVPGGFSAPAAGPTSGAGLERHPAGRRGATRRRGRES